MDGAEQHPEQGLAKTLLKYRDILFAYILALVRDMTVAEDIFQDVSLVILRKESEGVQVRSFGPWSREIARRTILNYWKSIKRNRLIFSSEAIDSIDNSFAGFDDETDKDRIEVLDKLRKCIKKLPERLRRIVRLRYEESVSFTEIARQFDSTAGAVQVAVSRARMRLLDCVENVNATEGYSQ
jgi:RNA polymerase sigma-70 factor